MEREPETLGWNLGDINIQTQVHPKTGDPLGRTSFVLPWQELDGVKGQALCFVEQ